MGKNKNLLKLGVLVSGSGSNLQSIIDNINDGKLKAKIEVVVSNIPEVFALERAKKNNIPVEVIEHTKFETREAYDTELVSVLKRYKVELVVMAGFMRILSSVLLRAFHLRIMNIHPALLPSFPGLHVQKKALEYGVKFSGCTVHFADEGTDTGPIIIQGIVPVYDDDTADTLAQRILREEHKIYPQAIQLFAEGRLEIRERRVFVKNGERVPEVSMLNPPYLLGK